MGIAVRAKKGLGVPVLEGKLLAPVDQDRRVLETTFIGSKTGELYKVQFATVLPLVPVQILPMGYHRIPPKSPFSRPAQSHGDDEAITMNDTLPPASAPTSSLFSHQARPTHLDRKLSHYPPCALQTRPHTQPRSAPYSDLPWSAKAFVVIFG